jgi:hypothetical protein
MPEVRRHGGSCCGMSHIYNLGSIYSMGGSPGYAPERDMRKREITEACNRAFANNKRRGWFRSARGIHLIEAVTAERDGDPFGQTKHIGPILEELGFQKSSEFRNANSGNACVVWHLMMDKKIT